ncbi:MAG: YkgJ family cysteine cluster protein [Crenarchaeota archaeon]|nr:YkgJ family cysteine cluster protein [Thermoproteota archaeon]
MELSNSDIARLEKKGYVRQQFVKFDKYGYALLRNKKGHCFFYNQAEKKCDVYADRPAGCRVYPVIFHEEKGIIIDNICSAKHTITQQEKIRKGKRVIKLLEKIDFEAKKPR